jgi:penicillin-binding protein 1A
LNSESKFNAITKANFENPSKKVITDLDCDPNKHGRFIKRLFKKKTKRSRLIKALENKNL